jgi:hypothetical protein
MLESHPFGHGPLGHLPGGRPWQSGLPGAESAVVQAFRRLTATTSSLDPIVSGHVWKIGKNGQSPKICRALVPGRTKCGSHYETRCTQKGTRKQSWFIQKIFFCRSKYNTHNLKQADRVKKNIYICMWIGITHKPVL